MTVKTTN